MLDMIDIEHSRPNRAASVLYLQLCIAAIFTFNHHHRNSRVSGTIKSRGPNKEGHDTSAVIEGKEAPSPLPTPHLHDHPPSDGNAVESCLTKEMP
ncbi:hypothetical protein [Halomonas lysinitropha]|uniref:hypothetical protein n=1 Tax=Halomonas lysinitropha TaxID=2607506 RepID=UPI001249C340|nr:hypothetical protein [Halomonas lysinitropha]